MSGVSREQGPPPQKPPRGKRDALLGQFYMRLTAEADADGDTEAAERHRGVAMAFAGRYLGVRLRRIRAPRAPRRPRRVRDVVFLPTYRVTRRGGHRRPRERRDGSRSSGRSGDSGSGEPEPPAHDVDGGRP